MSNSVDDFINSLPLEDLEIKPVQFTHKERERMPKNGARNLTPTGARLAIAWL